MILSHKYYEKSNRLLSVDVRSPYKWIHLNAEYQFNIFYNISSWKYIYKLTKKND